MALVDMLGNLTIWGIIQVSGPVWIAFILGIMVGWGWKPIWARLWNSKFQSTHKIFDFSPYKYIGFGKEQMGLTSTCRSEIGGEESVGVGHEDFEYLRQLVERKDGGPPWKHMMEHSTKDMMYQAWQRDPQSGPPQYCSRTVYEDATPELLRDFFWDDEFRLKWDNMILHASTAQECPNTGAMVVHWLRKFPFFCSHREYVIARRIWESERSYFCVTKGVPCESIPRKEKPRRVDLYYSSWYIQAVKSTRGDGEKSACEVVLFHYEDIGIPYEIAKFGVRRGMWATVKNIALGFRAYQKHRATTPSLSHQALMAQKYTKLPSNSKISQETTHMLLASDQKPKDGLKLPRLLIVGAAAVAVACSLKRGLLTKALIFGIAKRFNNIGRGV